MSRAEMGQRRRRTGEAKRKAAIMVTPPRPIPIFRTDHKEGCCCFQCVIGRA